MKIKYIPAGICAALAVIGTAHGAWGQTAPVQLPFDSIQLSSLSAFRAPGSNWRVAGAAMADPASLGRLNTAPGFGVIVNVAPAGTGQHLVSRWEHGDLELELDFMMLKGSNSGVYLQGRYEVQLLDSWGVKTPSFADAGGIYQRWDPRRGRGREGYEGVPPRINASRAPGLWQHLRILFQAPRFDARGNKITNARFVRVEYNGVVIHENVEVTGPTRGAVLENERPTGPLLIQGDHGPVALRDIRFKRYSGQRVKLADLRYRAYEAESGEKAYAMNGATARQGPAEAISSSLAGAQDKFAVAFDGIMDVPASGRYRFDLGFDWIDSDPHFSGVALGGGKLMIGGREVLMHGGRQPSASGDVELKAGKHPFSLAFYKNRPWTNRSEAALFVEGPQIQRHALHAASNAPAPLPGAITVQPEREAVVLRSFVRHGRTKRTHAVSVGDPSGVHYSFDLANGALLQAWRGPFLETTPMWHERGNDQIAEPLGSRLILPGTPSLAFLAGENAAWPDSVGAAAGYTLNGYELDPVGRPTFHYRLRAVEVDDRLRPGDDGASLRRELRLRAPDGTSGLFLRLAAGDTIRPRSDGSFVVGDMSYYIASAAGAARPVVRGHAGQQELLMPVQFRGGEANFSYTMTW